MASNPTTAGPEASPVASASLPDTPQLAPAPPLAAVVPRPRRRRARVPAMVKLSMFWLALMLVVAVGADRISPFSYTALDLRNRLSPPVGWGGKWLHPLGTDELGRDVLSRLIMSIRMSLLIAATMVTANLVVDLLYGVLDPRLRAGAQGST